MAAAVRSDCDVKTLVSNGAGALAHLERCFFGDETPWQGEQPPIRLYQAETPFSEVEYVSSQLRRLARQGVRCAK